MQTLTLQVQDNFIPNLLNYLEQFKNEVTIKKDRNLEIDPYFYERKKKLHQIRDDVHNGKMRLLTQEESDEEIELFFEELENN
jgi:hypothetical protein